jgi:hypothetical protein
VGGLKSDFKDFSDYFVVRQRQKEKEREREREREREERRTETKERGGQTGKLCIRLSQVGLMKKNKNHSGL